MEDKRPLVFLQPLLALWIFSMAALLHAQEPGPIVHRLTWQPVDYASSYEVVVEVLAGADQWLEVIRKTTDTDTFVDCPLFIGNYRFRVSAYDLLGKLGSTAEWVYFEVRLPEGSQASPPGTRQSPPEYLPSTASSPWPAVEKPSPEEEDKTIYRLELLLAPIIILPFSSFNEIYSTDPIQPLGAAIRFSILPFVTKHGTFGFDILPSWNFLANDILHNSRYTHIVSVHGSVVWQIRPISRNTALNFRAGFGMSHISSRFDFNDGRDIENMAAWNPSIIVNAAFLKFLSNSLFLDIGLEYYQIMARDNMAINYLRPTVGLGWWF
jgi:hypothetical protein